MNRWLLLLLLRLRARDDDRRRRGGRGCGRHVVSDQSGKWIHWSRSSRRGGEWIDWSGGGSGRSRGRGGEGLPPVLAVVHLALAREALR
jgi:hypothetical protein